MMSTPIQLLKKRTLLGAICAFLTAILIALPTLIPATAEITQPENSDNKLAAANLGKGNKPLPEIVLKVAGEIFTVEIAVTQADLLKGLMYRPTLAKDRGMLFPFFPPRAVNFWMKNTLIPLDMLFIRNKQIVNIEQNAQPCKVEHCPTYQSIMPVDIVIEVPAGTVDRLNIQLGDPILLYSKADLEKAKKLSQPAGKSPTEGSTTDDPIEVIIPPKADTNQSNPK